MTDQPKTCPVCDRENQPQATTCRFCGAPLSRQHPRAQWAHPFDTDGSGWDVRCCEVEPGVHVALRHDESGRMVSFDPHREGGALIGCPDPTTGPIEGMDPPDVDLGPLLASLGEGPWGVLPLHARIRVNKQGWLTISYLDRLDAPARTEVLYYHDRVHLGRLHLTVFFMRPGQDNPHLTAADQPPPPTRRFVKGKLLFLRLTETGQELLVDPHLPGGLILGRGDPASERSPDVDLTNFGAQQAGVSRRHARLAADEAGTLTLIDLDSANGTWLNGQRLPANLPGALQDGDEIRLGLLKFIITFVESPDTDSV